MNLAARGHTASDCEQTCCPVCMSDLGENRAYVVRLKRMFRAGDLAFEFIDAPDVYRTMKLRVETFERAADTPIKRELFNLFRNAALRGETMPDHSPIC